MNGSSISCVLFPPTILSDNGGTPHSAELINPIFLWAPTSGTALLAIVVLTGLGVVGVNCQSLGGQQSTGEFPCHGGKQPLWRLWSCLCVVAGIGLGELLSKFIIHGQSRSVTHVEAGPLFGSWQAWAWASSSITDHSATKVSNILTLSCRH